ncbi:ATPase AAA [Achromatium sp. WMS2]|nr:ATPase AAA [Achromatium sp. WMS2]
MNKLLESLVQNGERIILGKGKSIRLAVACLLAKGHLLIEDLPGVGKTTLAHLLARLIGMQYSRIQFTSDLLPADIVGSNIYSRESQSFTYHSGPIFAQVVLADEINRATPKSQSALLEAMEEHQVTVEGVTRSLPEPFFVVATQNPTYQIGTFALPESQMDRFLMRIHLGYPDEADEKALFKGKNRREMLAELKPIVELEQFLDLQKKVCEVVAKDPIIDYCYRLVAFSRSCGRFLHGLSPRGGLALLAASRAWALLAGRDYVLPEDVQAVAPACLGHRLITAEDNAPIGHSAVTEYLLNLVPIA